MVIISMKTVVYLAQHLEKLEKFRKNKKHKVSNKAFFFINIIYYLSKNFLSFYGFLKKHKYQICKTGKLILNKDDKIKKISTITGSHWCQ